MPKCVFCGLNAGVFRSTHPNCEHRVTEGGEAIARLLHETERQTDYAYKKRNLYKLVDAYFLSAATLEGILVDALKQRLQRIVSVRLIEDRDIKEIEDEARGLGLSQQSIYAIGFREELIRANEIRVIKSGRPSKEINTHGIVMSSDEEAIKSFFGIDFEEDVNKRVTIRRSSGASGRVMRGLWINQSQSRSETNESIVRTWKDCGCLLFTKSSLYFKGNEHAFRIGFKDIIAIDHSFEGFSVMKKSSNSRWKHFVLKGIESPQLNTIAKLLIKNI